MTAPHKIAIIGLGVIGQRMLANMPNQGRLEIIGGWDLDPRVCVAAKKKFPWLTIADSYDLPGFGNENQVVYSNA